MQTTRYEQNPALMIYYHIYSTADVLLILSATSDDHPDSLAPTWFPDGPSFRFFPYPVIDDARPWGHQCNDCRGKCSGHYVTSIDALLQLRHSAKAIRALPPSVIIEEAFKKNKNGPRTLQPLAKKCCLTEDQVQMWWDHLRQNTLNRARGAEKAKATRLRKKQQQNNST